MAPQKLSRLTEQQFKDGAKQMLEFLQREQIKTVILKAKSPSCGSGLIYDGTYSGTKRPGVGVTTALLQMNGITVYSDEEIEK